MQNIQVDIRPQDLLVALKLAVTEEPLAYAGLAASVGLSASEGHAAVRRLRAAGLVHPTESRVNRTNLFEFLVHGVKYVLPAKRGALARGTPTAWAAGTLARLIGKTSEPPPVWPDPLGNVRGETFLPIFRSAPAAARLDPRLYECLTLVDAIRGGRARERTRAIKLLEGALPK